MIIISSGYPSKLTPLNVHLILVLFFVVVLTAPDTVVVLGGTVLGLVGGLRVVFFVVKIVKAEVGGGGRRVEVGGRGFLPLFGGWD